MKRVFKRVGAAAFLFFLVKGLIWLAVLAGATVWAGGAGAAGRGGANAGTSTHAAVNSGAEGAARLLPMHLGKGLQFAVETGGQWLHEVAWHEAMAPSAAGAGLIALLLVLAALRIRTSRRSLPGPEPA